MIRLQLATNDLTAVKLDNFLCSDLQNCHLQLPPSAVEDMACNQLEPAILRVTEFIRDTAGPILLQFHLHLNLGRITLTFNEPIQRQLTGGSILTTNAGLTLEFSLLPEDMLSKPRTVWPLRSLIPRLPC